MLGTGNTEENNNKRTESSRTETESKAMRKRSKYLKVQVNETGEKLTRTGTMKARGI